MTHDFRSLANSHVSDIVPYQPGKPIAELERELGVTSAIKLASNENPLGASLKALSAAKEVLLQCHIYPDGGSYELKTALSHFLSVPIDRLTIGNGSENILELIVKSYLSPLDNAVISEYAFATIPLLIKSYGATLRVAKARHFTHDVDAMLQLIDDKTRIVFLVNPNNPTGTYTTNSAFQTLMENVPSDVLVVVDEAYLEYIDEADYPNVMDYLPLYPNLIVSRTFSKVYGLAGLRLGYALASPVISDILNRARLPFNVNVVAASAACAALTDHDHLQQTIQLNKRVRTQLEQAVVQLGLSYIPSVANFLTINVGHGLSVYEKLLHHGVIVRPLGSYNMPSYIRVSTGTESENSRFLKALPKCL